MFALTSNGLRHIKNVATFWGLAAINRDIGGITNPEIKNIKAGFLNILNLGIFFIVTR